MQNLNLIKLSLVCTLIILTLPLASQNHLIPNKTNTAIQLYNNTFDSKLLYINGREYKPYHHPNHQNPFLQESSGIGSIFINGIEYSKKQLTYDIYKDLLIVIPDHPKFSSIYLQINKSKVDSFTINFDKASYHLINYKPNECPNGLEPGFYQPIYTSSNTTLLLKHYAIIGVKDALPTYGYETDRYLSHNNHFYNISRKKNLLKLFPNNKKVLKKQIKAIHYSYKKMNNTQLIQLASYIDTL